MATKAKVVFLAKVATSIEIASEGYPEYCGEILQNHYKTDKNIEALLAKGDIERLESTPDRLVSLGETAKTERFVGTMSQLSEGTWAEYIYVFNAKDKTWYLLENGDLVRLNG
ncbi:hypothetical protein [Streptococcus suis]|uniref:hypothetical protein n=1 Tax=Streptococcus suis TaxID=1307 RepID=UPI000CF594D9|nr:hypothetical protein [Streptococcus suis]